MAGVIRHRGQLNGLRYLVCSLCACEWHYVRLKCSHCRSTKKLDYLHWLGVDCLWVPPFFESPLRDGGYEVERARVFDLYPDTHHLESVTVLVPAAQSAPAAAVVEI